MFLFQQYSKPVHLIRNVYVQTLLNCYLFPFSVNRVQLSLNCTEGCVVPMLHMEDAGEENTSGSLKNSTFHEIR
jgi:hypothetical protein